MEKTQITAKGSFTLQKSQRENYMAKMGIIIFLGTIHIKANDRFLMTSVFHGHSVGIFAQVMAVTVWVDRLQQENILRRQVG